MGVEEDKELHLYMARSTGLWISSELMHVIRELMFECYHVISNYLWFWPNPALLGQARQSVR